MTDEIESDESDSRVRLARTRLSRWETRDEVGLWLRRGRDHEAVADTLGITVAEVARIARGLLTDPCPGEGGAEELIVRAAVDADARRAALVEDLGGLVHRDGGGVDLVDADLADGRRHGWLTAAEEDRVRHIWFSTRAAEHDGWTTPVATAAAIRTAHHEGDELAVLILALAAARDLNQMIAAAPDLLPAWDAAPPLVDTPWDELLAAVIGHEFDTAGLPAPGWTTTRTLTEDWVPEDETPIEEVRADTPDWLAQRHILIRTTHLENAHTLYDPGASPGSDTVSAPGSGRAVTGAGR